MLTLEHQQESKLIEQAAVEQSSSSTSSSGDVGELDPVYAQFRDQSRFWIQRVAVPLLMVIGLFGNSMTVIIMTRRRMRSTTNMYLAALAFVDMLYLVLTFLLGLSHYPNMAELKYYYYWKLRPFLMMLTDACSNTSVWLTVSFTIERYIAVKYPMKGKVWCTESRAKLLIVCVFAFGILFALPVPFEWKVTEKRIESTIIIDEQQQRQGTTTAAINGIIHNNQEFQENATSSIVESSSQLNDKSSSSGQLEYHYHYANTSQLPSVLINDGKTRPFNSEVNIAATAEQPTASGTIRTKTTTKTASILTLDYSDFGRNETYKTIYYWSTAVIFYFIPLFSLMLFNGFLIKSVHKSKRERTKMTNTIRHNHSTTAPRRRLSNSKSDINLANNGRFNSTNEPMTRDKVVRGSASGDLSKPLDGHVKFRLFSTFSTKKRSLTECNINAQESYPPVEGGLNIVANKNSAPKSKELTPDDLLIRQKQPCRFNTQQTPTALTSQIVVPVHDLSSNVRKETTPTMTGLNGLDAESSSVQSSCDNESVIENLKQIREENKITSDNNCLTVANSKSSEQHSIHRQGSTKSQSMDSSSTSNRQFASTINRTNNSDINTVARANQGATTTTSYQPASSQERRITIMLIAVVILFLVCQIPSAAILLYTSIHEMVPNTNEHALVLAFGNIFNFMMAVNAAGNFILYSFLSKKYRRTFVILFCSRFKQKQQVYQPNRMTSVRFNSSQYQRNTNSIYQNSSVKPGNDNIRRDTLV